MDAPVILSLLTAFTAVIGATAALIQGRAAARRAQHEGMAAVVKAMADFDVAAAERNKELFARLADANDRWQATDAELNETKRELACTRDAVTKMAAELAQTRVDLDATRAELCRTRAELDAARLRETELLGRIDSLEQERANLAAEVKRLASARSRQARK